MEEKKTFRQKLDDHPIAVFWSRFVSWTLFSLILPATFIIWRFDLFKKISKIQLGGWSIFLIILAAAFVFTIIKYIHLAFKGHYSFIGQCLSGFCKIVLPLLIVLLIVYSVQNTIEMLIQVLSCVTLCEAIAIPINPLPKWAYDMQKDLKDSEKLETMDYVLAGLAKRREKSEKGIE